MNDSKIDNILVKQSEQGLKVRFGDLDTMTMQAIKRSDYIKDISCNISQYDYHMNAAVLKNAKTKFVNDCFGLYHILLYIISGYYCSKQQSIILY